MPAPQLETENCVAHNGFNQFEKFIFGSMVPGRNKTDREK